MTERSPLPHYVARPWTKEEDTELDRLKNEGKSNAAIGYRLSRSEYAIERRLRRLSITPPQLVNNWLSEHDALLREFWPQKHVRLVDIGITLKRSRNAVIGRAHRIGLPPRGKPRLHRPKNEKPPQFRPRLPRHDKTGQPFLLRHYGPQTAPTMIPEDPYRPGPGVPLLEATENQCRAIIVSSRDNDGFAVFCGEPKSPHTKFSFCEYHRQKCTYRR